MHKEFGQHLYEIVLQTLSYLSNKFAGNWNGSRKVIIILSEFSPTGYHMGSNDVLREMMERGEKNFIKKNKNCYLFHIH